MMRGLDTTVRKLRRQGKICFDGKGGHGKWIVCDDKEGE